MPSKTPNLVVEAPYSGWKDYALVDSGDFEKLEKFGPYYLRRPEPKALWHKSMSEAQWQKLTHTHFEPGAGFAKAGKEDSGTWRRLRTMPDQWEIGYVHEALDFRLRLGLTSFKHVGVFPEQASNWDFIYKSVQRISKPSAAPAASAKPRVLNLFAYTGAASIAAKKAGADVTHLDSVKQVVTWARDNQERSGIDGIRWVVEDALKFAAREAKRGNLYDGIILDPPSYGHGPNGEKWKLDECLLDILKCVKQILKPKNSFLVLNLYSNGYSAALAQTLVEQVWGLEHNFPGLTCGELALEDSFHKVLPLSVVVRLSL